MSAAVFSAAADGLSREPAHDTGFGPASATSRLGLAACPRDGGSAFSLAAAC